MKAFSMWQPWASAVSVGAKRVETRSRATAIRGPIAIHAAKRKDIGELIWHGSCWNWCGALRPLGLRMGGDKSLDELLPFGAIVAIGELVDSRRAASFTVGELDSRRRPIDEDNDFYDWTERQMGDFSPGRHGWVLANVRRLLEPIPFRGYQSFFHVPDSIARAQCHPSVEIQEISL